MSDIQTSSKTIWLMNQLKLAADAKGQFRFYRDYYDYLSPEGCSVALDPENFPKNRNNFWGFPYDHNLITSVPSYINASPMEFNTRRYIAAQGPRNNTFNEFWQMILAEKAGTVVSVTNEQEEHEGQINFKFNQFWPVSGTLTYGPIAVTLLEETLIKQWNDGRQEKLYKRKLRAKKDNQEHDLTHFHMENWLDGEAVHPESLITLSHHIDVAHTDGPIVVHCAAGVGRTGTVIAFHSLYNDVKDQLSNIEDFELNIAKRVAEMREKRWGAMIADVKQYDLLLEALRLALT